MLAGCGGQALAEVLRRIEDAEPAVRARVADLVGNAPDADIETVNRLLRDRDPSVREAARRSWMRLKARPRAAISIISLGEFRVLRDGVTIPSAVFVRQKARALLACLVASGGPVHRETLCEWLWPELAPDRAAASLRSTLYDLRRAVEPELEAGSPLSLIGAEGDMIRLALSERDRCDAVDLAELATGPAGDEQIDRLTLAEALYRGPFLADWPFEDWAARPRAELEEVFKRVVEHLAAALVDAGRPREAIPRYRRLLLLEPEREGWHRDLMRAHAATGERALALRQFHACRTLLRREQGVEPDAETRALYAELLREEDVASVL